MLSTRQALAAWEPWCAMDPHCHAACSASAHHPPACMVPPHRGAWVRPYSGSSSRPMRSRGGSSGWLTLCLR
jgi:hypothetical protein